MQEYMWLVWLIAALLAGVLEAMTVQLVSAWFVIGGIAASITSVYTDEFIVQFVVFIAVSLVLTIATRPFANKLVKFQKTKTNSDRYIGKTGKVVMEINNDIGQGQVNIGGNIWSARSVDGKNLSVDTEVLVEDIEGVKLMVSQNKG